MLEDLDVLLEEISSQFEENVKRGFTNECMRLQLSTNSIVPMQNVSISDPKASYTQVSNINWLNHPDFNVRRFKVDLANAHIDVKFSFGVHYFDVDMQMVNQTMFKNMTMVVNNNVRIVIKLPVGEGRIGLFCDNDSLSSKNYHIDYYCESIELQEIDDKTGEILQKVNFNFQDISPASLFFAELNEKLNKYLHKQLNTVIADYSIEELVSEEEEIISEFKDRWKKNKLKGNVVIDVLVDRMKRNGLLKNSEMRTQFFLPYKPDNTMTWYSMEAIGLITGIETLTRPSDWSYYEDLNEQCAFGYLRLRNYKFLYEYKTEYMNTLIKGRITATVYKIKFSVEINLGKTGNYSSKLPKIYIAELSDIEVDTSGLGSLSWLEKRIKSIIIGHIRWETNNKVKEYLIHQISKTCSLET